MPNKSEYNKRLSREEVISRLDEFLNTVKNDYSFLWEGSPSLINSYPGAISTHFGRKTEFASNNEFNRFVPLKNLPGKFDYLGIVKESGKFKFYLESSEELDYELYENGKDVYNALETKLDLGAESFINNSGKGIYTCLESILQGQLHEKLKGLKEKLKIE